MTDTEIIQKVADLENRILYLEMMHRIEPMSLKLRRAFEALK